MQRSKLAMLGSGLGFGLAIISCPDQFLFAKTVPNSFWTEYFPLPFGAAWFLTWIVLVPVVWMSPSLPQAIKASITALLLATSAAVPISMLLTGGALTANNLFNQYLWVGMILVPPYLLHLALRWCWHFLRFRGDSSKPSSMKD